MAGFEDGRPPTMASLIETELHLVLSCHGCGRSLRLTPTEAADRFGHDVSFEEVRHRLRCGWCGAKRKQLDLRPDSADRAAKMQLEQARRQNTLWPNPGAYYVMALEKAEAEWEARRPKDGPETMCNAYKLTTPISVLFADMKELGYALSFPGDAMPNLAPIEMSRPTNVLPAFRPHDPTDPSAGLDYVAKRWWLVPFFHRGGVKEWKAMCTNARAESVVTSPTFREPFKRRRCLIPADGYYEWTGDKTPKARWLFELPDKAWFSFAGLWDKHEHEGVVTESFTIITTTAGPDAAPYHTRQPVIIERSNFAQWLDLSGDPLPLLKPSPEGALTVTAA